MVVCFCLNNLGAFGLGATVNSLIKNCSDNAKLRLYFFCSRVDNRIKKSIADLLNETEFMGSFQFIDFDPKGVFGNCRGLQGDYTAYGRLLIPDIICESQILYLDSDLIIETDILEFENINLNKKTIGAVAGSSFKYSLEQNFFINILHLDPNIISLNSGVLVINIQAWNLSNTKENLLAVANKYPDKLLSADQTLLNAYFGNDYFHLPPKFNVVWHASKKPTNDTDVIFHFGGSPKPWDFFGKYLHSGYKKWNQYNPSNWQKNVLKLFLGQQIKRSWAIKRSYLKVLLRN